MFQFSEKGGSKSLTFDISPSEIGDQINPNMGNDRSSFCESRSTLCLNSHLRKKSVSKAEDSNLIYERNRDLARSVQKFINISKNQIYGSRRVVVVALFLFVIGRLLHSDAFLLLLFFIPRQDNWSSHQFPFLPRL